MIRSGAIQVFLLYCIVSVISETSEHEQLTSVSELSVITSEPSDNGHCPASAGPTLDMSETLEEEQLMSVLATSGLNCHDSGDCQLPSSSIPSTSHCVTVKVHAAFSPLPPPTPTHNQSPLEKQQEEISVQRKRPGKHSSAKLNVR